MKDKPILRVSEVSKRFGGIRALDRVSLHLNEGEILGLIGPNGSGKTTLINVISGFYKPDSGKVFFKNEDITGKPPYYIVSKGVVRTFQLTRPFGGLTVLSNVTLGTLYNIKDVAKAKERALNILKQIDLYEKKDMLTKNLSVPDKRKLELARALALEPKVMLLDEVLAGLTPAETDAILNLIDKVRKEKSISIIIVEHVVKAIMKIADRVVVLNAGKKTAEGDPMSIVNNEEVIKVYLGSFREYVTPITK